MKLNHLSPTPGSRRDRKRLGCGLGSGQGKTGGRGHKGQTSRSGGKVRRGFEGGQMPLARRLPKRGFFSQVKSANTFQIVNVGQLEQFADGSHIDADALYLGGLIRNPVDLVKLLGDGATSRKLTVSVFAASEMATKKIEAAGGTVTCGGAD